MRHAVPAMRTCLLLAAMTLTGCVRAEVDLTVTEARTVNGTVLLAWDRAFLEDADRDPATAQEDILDDLVDDAPDGMTCEPYEDGDWIGATCSLDGVRMEAIHQAEAFDQRLTLLEAGDQVVLSAVIDLDEVPADQPIEASVRVTFPGEVIDATGSVDGRTVTWEPEPGRRTELEVTARLTPAAPAQVPLPLVALIVAVVAVAGVLAFSSRSSGSRPGAEDPRTRP